MSDWQPIETAPKDGRLIIVTNDEAGGCWVARYHPQYTSGYRPDNPWSCMLLNRRHCKKYSSSVPTVWQPFPND